MSTVATVNDYDLLKKPVNTLAIVPVSRKITVLGRKMYNVMLDMSQAIGIDNDVYRAPLTEIVSGIDYGSNDLELIKKHLRAMATTSVEWNSPTTGEGPKWTVCTLIAHATLTKEKGQIWVEWSYAKPIKQELLEPSVFARLSLGMLSQMHTYSGIALYEICSRYRAVGRTSRQEWRWWLPVLSGQPNTDERLAKMEYRFFKRDSIKPAIAEINAITDIEVELVEYKAGKSINELQFLVKPKAQVSLPLKSKPKPVDMAIVSKAVTLGIGDDKAEELITQFGSDAVSNGLVSLEKRIAFPFPEPLRDSYRYLKVRLEGDQMQKVAEHKIAQGAQADQAAELVEPPVNKKKENAVKASWQEEWMRRQRAKATQMLRELQPEAIADLSEQLLEHMAITNAHPSIVKRMQTSGWDHNLVRHMMVDYFAKATLGEAWDKPTTEQLLEVASQMAELPAQQV
jgi:plasmid replication initiation protein